MLSNYRLLSSNGNELTQEELNKLFEFYNMMSGSLYSRFIFRGESDKNLMRQFNVDTKTPGILSECLFMTGEKGRICWADNEGINPDDVSTENFLRICMSLAKYIDEGLRAGGNRAKRIKTFCEKEKKFYDGIKKGETFVDAYDELKPEVKRKVNLNYLAVAHTIGDKEYKETSGYISTTTNAGTAERFARDACIFGWVPQNIWKRKARKRTIDIVDTNQMSEMQSTGLPYCDSAVFPNQEEIAIRCGLLPHFIIGYAVEQNFYVNPAIFIAIDRMHEMGSFREKFAYKRRIQLHGLVINQENFEEFCQRTNFKKYFTFDDGDYVMHRMLR
jgi:hypothetical protein